MIRRVHVEKLQTGSIALSPSEAHHVRDVLRMSQGDLLEIFDDDGSVATGPILQINPLCVVVLVESIHTPVRDVVDLTVAAAVPKGDRADWMIEKLTELGVARFIPLITQRSVVIPGGKNKLERWERIALEAAKQSRRSGTMKIEPLISLDAVIATHQPGWFLSTGKALPTDRAKIAPHHHLFIGPEGGWSDLELERLNASGLQGVSLTSTILRVETAAVIAAGVVLCRISDFKASH